MQNELLIEILSEEIPARLQRKAEKDAKSLMQKLLGEFALDFTNVSVFTSPRRMAIRVLEVPVQTTPTIEEKRGPRSGSQKSAIEGFLAANNKTKHDLYERQGYYYVEIRTALYDTKDVIPLMLERFLTEFTWPKSMRWWVEKCNTLSLPWIRPIRSIMCLYDEGVIRTEIKQLGLETAEFTYGHRFLSAESIDIFDFDDYRSKLERNHVMLDRERKRTIIDRGLAKMAASMGLCLQQDDDLLDEIAGLVEYPFIHIGAIDEKFMSLPPQVLSASMKVHQKYFTLVYPNSTVAPFFGTVTNVPETEVMHAGLEKVLRARLSDALFFFEEDKKISLDAFSQKLSSVVFQEKLDSLGKKIERLLSFAKTKEESRAISLSKADLLTQMVGEFPELQGVMGGIYARIQGEDETVAMAIMEHHKPVNANDSIPSTRLGCIVSLLDKLDTIVGFIGIGTSVTGSKDPFSLRRSAIGIVKILCESDHNIFSGKTISEYVDLLIQAYSDQNIALSPKTNALSMAFLIERLKWYILEQIDDSQDFVDAVIASFDPRYINFRLAFERAIKLGQVIKDPAFEEISRSYKRASGILSAAEEQPKSGDISTLSFDNQFMKDVQTSLLAIRRLTFCDVRLLWQLAKAVSAACENVQIQDPVKEVREKNLAIVQAFIDAINTKVGVLSKIK
jgi:glycyl-tRNA synthetase beta chain